MTRRGLFGIFAAAGAVAAKPEIATKTVAAVAAPKPTPMLIPRASRTPVVGDYTYTYDKRPDAPIAWFYNGHKWSPMYMKDCAL